MSTSCRVGPSIGTMSSASGRPGGLPTPRRVSTTSSSARSAAGHRRTGRATRTSGSIWKDRTSGLLSMLPPWTASCTPSSCSPSAAPTCSMSIWRTKRLCTRSRATATSR
ncbi:hypothetical protein Ctob_010978 [Chrysochromulina tobinii]|uniref:Uncharacterized protein n=1 Tax=Chrysochromulina tobinii TaxID=1460289 RepID=A0A0M0JU19_9EUKA|nr:hypothetical protein Ctob_010978 [Chrysochromulina tobinii]|eukprot:KOO30186.1 hypothetical protein Ctob_010978 [Chrysochromulina sp. CCMP291]